MFLFAIKWNQYKNIKFRFFYCNNNFFSAFKFFGVSFYI